jgi:protein-S-isoprenylcysteine O-methyltransferase Ste14
MRLVDDWRKALKWFSVQIPAVNVAFLATWAALPPKFQDALPVPWVIGIAVVLLVLGIVGRLIKQETP